MRAGWFQELTVEGENVNWYNDETLQDLVNTGDHFASRREYEAGIYTYYATQTLEGCVSPASSISLVIKEIPQSPLALNVEICERENIPVLVATGESIRWYDNAALEDVMHIGNSFESTLKTPGSYSFYATQTQDGCEGFAKEVELIISESPVISLGNDTVIHDDQDLILGPIRSSMITSGAILPWSHIF